MWNYIFSSAVLFHPYNSPCSSLDYCSSLDRGMDSLFRLSIPRLSYPAGYRFSFCLPIPRFSYPAGYRFSFCLPIPRFSYPAGYRFTFSPPYTPLIPYIYAKQIPINIMIYYNLFDSDSLTVNIERGNAHGVHICCAWWCTRRNG